jgi:predicted acetyltransferase
LNTTISNIKFEEKETLNSFLIQYLEELNQDTAYPYLDSYWENQKRIPLKLNLDEKWLGFALINDYTIIETNEIAIAEFYIQPEYRNQGYGHLFANYIFDNYKGKWELMHQVNNKAASQFWKKILPKNSKNIDINEVIHSFVL